MLFMTNYCIQHYTYFYTLLNGSKYCDVLLPIQLNINHFYTHFLDQIVLFKSIQYSINQFSKMFPSVVMYYYNSVKHSIKHQSFVVYTNLDVQTVLFQTIQFSISHLFTLCLIVLFDP